MLNQAVFRVLSPTLVWNGLLYGGALALMGVPGVKAAIIGFAVYVCTVTGFGQRLFLTLGPFLLIAAALVWLGVLPGLESYFPQDTTAKISQGATVNGLGSQP